MAYGTLKPGEANHWVVKKLGGSWYHGVIRAWQFDISWGAATGYPGIVLDPDAPECDVVVLVADKLEGYWHEIDRFEGEGYRRVPVEVVLADPLDSATTDQVDNPVIEPGTTILSSVYEAIQDNPD